MEYYLKFKQRRSESYFANKDKIAKKQKDYYSTHKDEYKKRVNENNKKIRLEVLIHYSNTNPPQCDNPFGEHEKPYKTTEALSIDHINGGGGKQREQLFGNKYQGGVRFYKWLRRNNYPEGYRVLCMNCQFISMRRSFNQVPHHLQ
jgi:hypothetical protein